LEDEAVIDLGFCNFSVVERGVRDLTYFGEEAIERIDLQAIEV
jgi:hypothetical protein